jgi:hypothetical protein
MRMTDTPFLALHIVFDVSFDPIDASESISENGKYTMKTKRHNIQRVRTRK